MQKNELYTIYYSGGDVVTENAKSELHAALKSMSKRIDLGEDIVIDRVENKYGVKYSVQQYMVLNRIKHY